MERVTSRSRAARVRRMWWSAAWAVTAAAIVADYFIRDDVAGEATYLFVVWGSTLVAWLGARRSEAPRRRISFAIAVGLGSSALADSIWSYFFLTRPSAPDVSIADFFWLASYVGLAIALFRMMAPRGPRISVDGLIDIVAVLTMALVVQWHVAIDDTVTDSTLPWWTRAVWALYPALDAVLLALVVRVLVGRRRLTASGVFIAAGAGCWLVSDAGYLMVDGGLDRWLNAGWLLGSAFLAATTWVAEAQPETTARAQDDEHIGVGRIAVALVPLLVPGIIETVTYYGHADPHPIPMLVASSILVGLALVRTVRILRAERTARRALDAEKRYARALAVHSSDAVAVVDREAVLRDDAPQLAALLGWPQAHRGDDLRSLIGSADAVELETVFQRCLGTPDQVFETEVLVRHANGHDVWLAVRMVNRLDDPDVRGVVVNIHEVTDRKLVEQELTRQAFHDSLTGLPNRVLFADRVAHSLRRAERGDVNPALVYLDLDGFKHVNDSLGHQAGDELLQEVALRLSAAVRAGDTVARLGGDEFALLIEQSTRAVEEATAVAERVLQALRVPITVDGRPITVSASIGIAIGDRAANAATLLRDGDIAMYQAKTSGRARWVVYDGEMRTAAVERLVLETDLLGALDRGELRVVYQPLVELDTEAVTGFEALVRWEHPRLGLLTPDRFLHIAEQNGLIVPIGRWVLETACHTVAAWHRDFRRPEPLSIAVNLSSRQLADPDLITDVAHALLTSRLAPSSLVLEMTETTLIEDPTAAAEKLHALRQLGIRLALDDFGTGYSSLSYLRQFPVDILKIDRSFVDGITEGGTVPAILRGLLDLGRTLELETVAEGIEQGFQHDRLREESCALGQGFLFARPLPPDEAERLLLRSPGAPVGPEAEPSR